LDFRFDEDADLRESLAPMSPGALPLSERRICFASFDFPISTDRDTD
jgi:hypothetical protein